MSIIKKQQGIGVIKMIALTPLVLIALVILAFIFTLLNKSYWDYRVRQMCEKDGGVHVSETVSITTDEAENLGRVSGYLTIGQKSKMRPYAPVFTQDKVSIQRSFSLRIIRHERTVIRNSDQKEIGKIISYTRVGGDFPDGISVESSYSCPENILYFKEQENFFTINNGENK